MNTNLPAISIVIPFYNAEKTLLNAIRSIYAQTHQDWELILIDDGSTDRSLELAHSIKDERVKVFSDGQNKRLAARLNQMAALATHDYIARMDADDIISPHRIEKQLRYLKDHPELDLVTTGVCSLSNDYKPLAYRLASDNHQLSAKNILLGRSGIVHASVIAKKTWFIRNPYRENIATGQDANLWVRAFSHKDLKVGFLKEPLYYYREDENVTPKKLKTAYRQNLKTIVKDSGPGYAIGEKLNAFSITLAKLLTVQILSIVGSLSYLRKRRNNNLLTAEKKIRLQKEIDSTLELELPLQQ